MLEVKIVFCFSLFCVDCHNVAERVSYVQTFDGRISPAMLSNRLHITQCPWYWYLCVNMMESEVSSLRSQSSR